MPKNKKYDVFKHMTIPIDGDIEPCWEWTGPTGNDGQRGYFSFKGIKWIAYRYVFTLVHGPLKEGEVVRHKCDNSLCCNPNHLERGSQSDNENDKYDRDRYGFPRRVLDDIIQLGADRESKDGRTHDSIAKAVSDKHGIVVSRVRVTEILNGSRRARQTGVKKDD